jgi:hypothetical protein
MLHPKQDQANRGNNYVCIEDTTSVSGSKISSNDHLPNMTGRRTEKKECRSDDSANA